MSVQDAAQEFVPYGSEFNVNTYTNSIQYSPAVTSLANGSFVVTWDSLFQNGGGHGIYGQCYSAEGVAVGGEFHVGASPAGNEYNHKVVALKGGGFVVTWSSDASHGASSGNFAKVYAADGSVIADGFALNANAGTYENNINVAPLGSGGFVATWISPGENDTGQDVCGQIYSATGLAVGDDFLVNISTQFEAEQPFAFSLTGGGFVVTWNYNGDPYGQVYAVDGSAVGTEFSLPYGGAYRVDALTNHEEPQQYVTSLANGGFVITRDWWDGSGIGVDGRVYAADGSAVSSIFQVNTTTISDQKSPSISSLASGGFVATWMSKGQDGSGYGIFGQLFLSDGSTKGGEFRVNTYTAGDQHNQMVVALADGGFLVTWQSEDQDGASSGIYGQAYASDGETTGGEFRINTFTSSNQYQPDVVALANGGFVAAWSSDIQDDQATSVFGQMFVPNHAPAITSQDAAYVAENATATTTIYTATAVDADEGDTLTYSILGEDAALFNIDATTGAVSFQTSPNYEVPTDVGADNVYHISVVVSDGTLARSQLVSISVTDVLEQIHLTADADVWAGQNVANWINGLGGNDFLSGGGAVDLLVGGAGNDTLSGGAGNDTLEDGSGNDLLTGGDGIDTVSYASAAAAVTLSLAVTAVQKTVGAGKDKLATIENLMGSNFADNLTGSAAANQIDGGAGNDTITGGAGADTLLGGDGDDVFVIGTSVDFTTGEVITGGVGTDELLFAATAAKKLVLGADVDVERVALARGGAAMSVDASAVLTGLTMLGNSGGNALTGTGFADTLDGGKGNDSLTGGAGFDFFTIGLGVDTVSDLSGGDVLAVASRATAYATLAEAWTATAASSNRGVANLTSAGFAVDLSAVIVGTTGFRVTNTGAATAFTGSFLADSLTGGGGADTLLGGAGNDTLVGGGGNDSLLGGVGSDVFMVTAGTDTILDLSGGDVLTVAARAMANAAVTASWTATVGTTNSGVVNLTTSGLAVNLAAVTSGSAGFTITNTGNATTLTGSARSDTLLGWSGADTLLGGAGNDNLNAGQGNDILAGGTGNDMFIVDAGVDTIIDLSGSDVLLISSGATATATVTAAWTATSAASNAGVATLNTRGFAVNLSATAGPSGFTVTNSGTATTLTGSGFADTLVGGSGRDTLLGGGGDDALNGGAGNDRLTGGVGIDGFTVGIGIDTITDLGVGGADVLTIASGATATIALGAAWAASSSTTNTGTATLTTNGFAVDLSGITGGSAGFKVTDTGTATTLTGSLWADTLLGGASNDTLVGGAGNDSLSGAAGNDSIDGGLGDDTLTGGAGNDIFSVGSGTDSITDLVGSDILTIASGATANATVAAAWTATSASSNAGIAILTTAGFAVNLAAASGTTGFAVTNTGAATTLTGSAHADTLLGGSGNDTLVGGAGDDRLTGAGGNDRLTGGTGADTFVFTLLTGVDHVTDFTSGSDHLFLSRSAMTAIGPIGALGLDAFWTGTAAHDATDRLIYNAATGALFYDADGTGSKAAVQIAVLDGHPAMAYTDVVIF